MHVDQFYPLAKTLPGGWFSEYDMEAICPALEAITNGGVYLEVGVHKGLSLAFARTVCKPLVTVCGIDPSTKIDRDWFEDKEHVEFFNMTSNEAVKEWSRAIDVLFIDGSHTYEDCKQDWKNFSPFVKQGGFVFFHDADSTSPGVVQVVTEIKRGWVDKTFYLHSLQKKTSMASVRKA